MPSNIAEWNRRTRGTYPQERRLYPLQRRPGEGIFTTVRRPEGGGAWAGRPVGAAAAGGPGIPSQYSGQQDIANLLYGRSMEQVSGDFASRGLVGSSMYAQASARAAAESQLAAWTLAERQAQFNLQAYQVRQQVQLGWANVRLNRQQLRTQWDEWLGGMQQQDYWNRMQAYSRAAPIRRPYGYGAQSQGGGGYIMANAAGGRVGGYQYGADWRSAAAFRTGGYVGSQRTTWGG